jgi:hypothetical protein
MGEVSVERWTGANIYWSYTTQQWLLTGPMKEVLNILSKNYFDSTLVRACDQQWGMYFQNNNTWTGMTSLVFAKKVFFIKFLNYKNIEFLVIS